MTTNQKTPLRPVPTVEPAGPRPVAPSSGAVRPLGLDEVRITGGFWARRQETNRSRTLAHIRSWLEREGWLGNFDLAADGALPAGRRGREFADSEVYKYLEALAWELSRNPDPELERELRRTVTRVGAAQEADGYLHTLYGRPGQAPRWSDLEWGHELYCFGHLFQAAVARERTAPGADDGLLDIALRTADLVCDQFGPQGRDAVCGHAEIETALAELGRVTGRVRYIDQARLFVDRRGRGTLGTIEFGQEYFQDDMPVREAAVLRGHAVRANYLAAGAVDVAVETRDDDLLDALETQWRATAARRTYITGGQGSHHQDEAFGSDFELPSDRAYSETCAGVASVQFSWRLLLARGIQPRSAEHAEHSEYADLIERTLYNVVATSPDDDGTAFYYANTLHQRTPGQEPDPEVASARASSSLRAPWFKVSCCPPNIARTLASLDGYLATVDDSGLQLHQYAPSEIRTRIAEQGALSLRVETAYPGDGTVTVHVVEAPDAPITLSLRVPAWAASATVDGEPVAPGYARLERTFLPGDTIVLELPMAPRVTAPDRRIDAVRGCAAVERGPIVHALESLDLPGGADVSAAELDPSVPLTTAGDAVVAAVRVHADPGTASWPYRDAATDTGTQPSPVRGSDGASVGQATAVPLVPYHRWAQRGPSTMRIWIPVAR